MGQRTVVDGEDGTEDIRRWWECHIVHKRQDGEDGREEKRGW